MPASTKELLTICRALPPQKVDTLVDFARFLRQQLQTEQDSGGDVAWERIVADTRSRPKLDAFVKAAMMEGSAEILDPDRL